MDLPDDWDPYRCPRCDSSALRVQDSDRTSPMRMACRVHGPIKPKYVAEYAYRIPIGNDEEEPDLRYMSRDDVLELWDEKQGRAPFAEELNDHCRSNPVHKVDGEPCPTCGRVWRLFDGVWFRDGRVSDSPLAGR